MGKIAGIFKISGAKLALFLKGILIGMASLGVPGLSASTIAIVRNIFFIIFCF